MKANENVSPLILERLVDPEWKTNSVPPVPASLHNEQAKKESSVTECHRVSTLLTIIIELSVLNRLDYKLLFGK